MRTGARPVTVGMTAGVGGGVVTVQEFYKQKHWEVCYTYVGGEGGNQK